MGLRLQRRGRMFWALALLLAAAIGGCRRAIVIVPHPDRSYTERDTLYGFHRGNRVVVSFRFDSVLRVDTVKVSPSTTLPNAGTPTPTRIPTRPGPTTLPGTGTRPGGDQPSSGAATRVDTVVVTRIDTVVVGRPDTVFVTKRDTLRVAGRRTLFVPPGQYPPAGQCRVWIHDLPPGRQADAVPCASLGNIPAGAFILFGGDAWDADYDWVAESGRGSVPPEIIAVSRRKRP